MKIIIYTYLFTVLFFSCKEANETKTLDSYVEELEKIRYSESVIQKTSYLDDFRIDSIRRNDRVISYYFTDNYYDYYSEINISQQIQFVFQDFYRLRKLEYDTISVYYTFPKREDSNEILVMKSNVYKFIESLYHFKYDEFNKLLNDLYILDSEYKQVAIIEALSVQLEISNSEINNRDPRIFGLHVNDFLLSFVFSCTNNGESEHKKTLYLALSELVQNKTIYRGVADEILTLFEKYCEEVEFNTVQTSI